MRPESETLDAVREAVSRRLRGLTPIPAFCAFRAIADRGRCSPAQRLKPTCEGPGEYERFGHGAASRRVIDRHRSHGERACTA